MAGARHKLSPFSVLLVMAVMMVAGAAVIPLLNVQYTPPRTASSISVRFSWPGASARLVEQEATSVIEGGLSMVDGLNGVYSTSRKGGGEVVVEFKKGARMDVARFEVASRLRYIYPSLPQEVSYPVLSLSASGRNEQAILGYTINSSLPPKRIEKYITANVMSALSRLPGVNRVELSGVAPFEYEISFDPDRADRYGISSSEIARAVTDWFGGDATGSVGTGEGNMLLLKIAGPREARFEAIPVGKSGDRIIYLGDLAKVRYHETAPTSYYRINGLNTVNISIWAERSSNIIGVAKEVREKMAGLSGNFPDGTSSLIGYDASEYVVGELNKIYTRTLLTLAILLLFVFVVSRSLRYLAVIVATLAANILVAFIFYYLFRLDIHIYSLAGITVSLGIIIDSSIIMTDHYGRHGDRRVFPAILGALLTTVASLSVIFFLPEEQRENLSDFALVVMINLIVSLLVSLMFIPSLLDKLPVGRRVSVRRYRRMRRTVRFNRIYMRFILWGRRRRWIFILLIVLGFGLPLHLLPPEIKQKDADNPNRWRSLYNKTVGGEFYQNNKQIFEKGLGGAFRLFRSATGSSGYYREPERQRLTIRAGMPEGCTVGQLNDVVGHMENFLNGFPEIEIFRTSIRSYDDATIEVSFKPEYENTGFPLSLKQQVIQAAINYGGATWGVYGIDENGFNNNVGTSYKSNRIILTGYNYDRLLRYAQELADTLSLNRRVSEAGVYAEVYWSVPQNEYYVALDRERIVRSGIDANLYFGNLRQLLFNTPLRSIFVDGKQERVSLVSSAGESFDLWNVRNNPLCIGEKEVKLSDFATITKQPSGVDIRKHNQSYELTVAFDFIGSYELAGKVMKRHVDRLNDEVLPIGFRARVQNYGWGGGGSDWRQFRLILLIAAIIYLICSIVFESLLKPLAIIMMIPVSFVGLFLAFGFSGWRFDHGGFAAFVLLSGLVVNAGIYVINEFGIVRRDRPGRSPLRAYVKGYSRKIVPVLLTVLSTVLGLIPFLVEGDGEVFWFSFAAGAMGGMLMSVVALVVILPVFVPVKRK